PIALWIPGKAQARLELSPTPGSSTQIASGDGSRSRIVEQLKDLHRAVVGLIDQHLDVCIPTQAQIQSQSRRDFVVILKVKRKLMEGRLTCIARSRVEGDLGNSARRGEALWIALHWHRRGGTRAVERRQVVLDCQR